jgi:hypothetical protein
MENSEEIQVIAVDSKELFNPQDRALLDTQITTAKQFPRNITKAVNNVLATVQIDYESAEECNYALKRGGKIISGPSVNLASAIAQQWGNLRVEYGALDPAATQVTGYAIAWDLETNYAVKATVKRSIMGSKGRFTDDMVAVTSNAAASIAMRNAVLKVIPKQVVRKCYKGALSVLTGDISTTDKLNLKRKQILDAFREVYKVSEEEVLAYVGKAAVELLNGDDSVTLTGVGTSIKNGDTTVEEQFRPKPVTVNKTALEKERERLLAFIEAADTLEKLNALAEHITVETKEAFTKKFNELSKPE